MAGTRALGFATLLGRHGTDQWPRPDGHTLSSTVSSLASYGVLQSVPGY